MLWWRDEDGRWVSQSVATLTSFGAAAEYKHVRARNFVLQGNNGAWVTLPSDYYTLVKKFGLVVKRWEDDAENDIDWDAYSAYRWSGVIVNNGTKTVVTNESVTFTDYEDESDPVGPDGDVDTDSVEDTDVVAMGGFLITADEIVADNGQFRVNSAVPMLALGGASDFLVGTGVFLGKSGGYYSMHVGDPAGQYMSFNGATGQLYVSGTIAGTIVSGGTNSNSWTINQDLTDTNVDLVFGRTTGGNGTLRWNGSTINALNTLQENGVTVAKENRQVLAGAGLTGGGDLSADRTLALQTPGTLTVATANSAAGSHTHAITSSSNPGAAASLLATDASGVLTLVRLNTDTLADRSGGNLTISPAGDITLDPGGNDVLPYQNYDLNLGALNKKYLTLHAAELWVETLVAQNTLATIGGRILVLPTNILIADAAAAATTLDVKYNNLANGDVVYLEAGGSVEFMAVASGATPVTGGYRYSVTRNLDGTGANDWYAGDAIANTGQAGNGFIDLYSVRGVKSASQAGPTLVGNVRSSATYNDWIEHWAVGELNGLYGYGATTFGAAFGKYAAGLPNVTVDATNGFRVRRFNTVLGQWQSDGDLLIGTDVTAAASTRFAVFNAAQTFGALSVDVGDLFLGDASGKRIFYDASTGLLDIVGSVRITDTGTANYGVNIGDAMLVLRLDGNRPFATDVTGNVNGHKGQVGTLSAKGFVFEGGMFGKALVCGETTTNMVKNPSAEATGNYTARGTATITRTTTTAVALYGTVIYQVAVAAPNDGIDLTLATLANATHYVTWWSRGTGYDTWAVSLNGANWYTGTLLDTAELFTGKWTRYGVQISAAQANGSTTLRMRNSVSSGNCYLDGVQVEQKAYPTPYWDGSFDGGASWSGTAHASSSTRPTTTLTYSTDALNLAPGTVMGWMYIAGSNDGVYHTLLRCNGTVAGYIILRVSSSGYPQAYWGTTAVTGAARVSGGWHHFATTNDGTTLTLYVDGAAAAAGAASGFSGMPTTFYLGSGGSSGTDEYANGKLSDVVFKQEMLSAAEIAAVYASKARVMTETNTGEIRLTAQGRGQVVGNADGLFGQDASGGLAFGLFTGAINTNAYGGASETLAAGDTILGSNAASKANLFWDQSTGRLNFRSGTTTNLYLSTGGVLSFNSNSGDGSGTGYAQWLNGSGTKIVQLIGEYGTGTDLGAAAGLGIYGYSDTDGRAGFVALRAIPYGGGSTGPGLNLSSSGNALFDLRNGSSLGTQTLELKTKTNSTNGQQTILYLDVETTGTAAQGLSGAMSFRVEDDGGTLIEVGKLGFGWKNAGAGSRNGVFFLSVADNGSYNEVARATKGGSWSLGGSGITSSPTYSFEFNDSNDLQAAIRADSSALNDDGWATSAIDYGEYVEKADYGEALEPGDIVYVKGRRASKRMSGGTPMIVSTRAGIRTGEPLHWSGKWLPEAQYRAEFGDVPGSIWRWAQKHAKPLPYREDGNGGRVLQPRRPWERRADGLFVLNPEWDFARGYVTRSQRPQEWIVVAFAGQVPVKVHGAVREGEFVVPSGLGDGYGKAAPFTVEHMLEAVGIAWETKDLAEDGTVVVAVGIK